MKTQIGYKENLYVEAISKNIAEKYVAPELEDINDTYWKLLVCRG